MSEQKGKKMNIKEIEDNMNRSLTIGDETIKDVYMTYVSPYEIEFLLTRIKALEGVVDWADKVVEMAEHLSVNGVCPLCTGGEVGCLVKHMEAALKKLEEV